MSYNRSHISPEYTPKSDIKYKFIDFRYLIPKMMYHINTSQSLTESLYLATAAQDLMKISIFSSEDKSTPAQKENKLNSLHYFNIGYYCFTLTNICHQLHNMQCIVIKMSTYLSRLNEHINSISKDLNIKTSDRQHINDAITSFNQTCISISTLIAEIKERYREFINKLFIPSSPDNSPLSVDPNKILFMLITPIIDNLLQLSLQCKNRINTIHLFSRRFIDKCSFEILGYSSNTASLMNKIMKCVTFLDYKNKPFIARPKSKLSVEMRTSFRIPEIPSIRLKKEDNARYFLIDKEHIQEVISAIRFPNRDLEISPRFTNILWHLFYCHKSLININNIIKNGSNDNYYKRIIELIKNIIIISKTSYYLQELLAHIIIDIGDFDKDVSNICKLLGQQKNIDIHNNIEILLHHIDKSTFLSDIENIHKVVLSFLRDKVISCYTSNIDNLDNINPINNLALSQITINTITPITKYIKNISDIIQGSDIMPGFISYYEQYAISAQSFKQKLTGIYETLEKYFPSNPLKDELLHKLSYFLSECNAIELVEDQLKLLSSELKGELDEVDTPETIFSRNIPSISPFWYESEKIHSIDIE